jgi:AcrR family transcriptional regulator
VSALSAPAYPSGMERTRRPRPRGRPRSEHVDDVLRTATLQLLLEKGYAGTSIERIAARAEVGKSTIYRRFGSKAELVFSYIVHDADLSPPPDSGSLVGDLTALLRRLLLELDNPVAAKVIPGVLVEVHGNPELSARFAATFMIREREVLGEVLARAVARGELTDKPDVPITHALLLGPVITWLYVFAARPPADFAEQLAGTVAAGLMHAPEDPA